MEKERFIELINLIKKRHSHIDEFYALGLNMFDTALMDSVHKIENLLIEQVYGKEGKEWIDWWIYEKADGNLEAWDEEGNPICQTVDDLWEYLEKK